jgi:hypothetical protein
VARRFKPKFGEENVDYFVKPRPKSAVRLRGSRRRLWKHIGWHVLFFWPFWVPAMALVVAGETISWGIFGVIAGVVLALAVLGGVTEWRSVRRHEERQGIAREWDGG